MICSLPNKSATLTSLIPLIKLSLFTNWYNPGKVLTLHFVSLQILIGDISENIEINNYDVLRYFDSKNLDGNINVYDDFLRNYLKEYEKVNLKPSIYKNIDEFTEDYLKNKN